MKLLIKAILFSVGFAFFFTMVRLGFYLLGLDWTLWAGPVFGVVYGFVAYDALKEPA